ncbi:multidrug effflux MFS transporter [Basilea psittacipulmonis]|uniref:Bcr/CflA family efflux transporter n=1 Tax=Basilea psittacipulmonis DSM 24701 TaxID=1072685 RepID=A0A077DGY6_9BURK|nr:multidrug effflux MFS transporter [Basilea psittacipulmonis]AIL32443.1 MFS transporter [Basilea psittacipulmonis DSM 24701]
MKTLNTQHPLFFVILGTLMAFTSLSTDIYLPAMPDMQKELNGSVELTVSGFLIGFALAQLLWGPISDRIGRKIPLFIGMVLYIIGSIGCAMAQSMESIILWRIFQAIGACTAPMLSRAIVRDVFARTQAVQMLSSLTLIMAIAPIAGPLIGGQMIRFSTWHSIFYLLASVGFIMFLSLFLLPETLPQERRHTGNFWKVFGNYAQLLVNKTFMKYTLCVSFFYLGQFAFVVGSPKVYIEYFHVNPQHYGWLFAVNVIGVMALSYASRFLIKHFSLNTLLKVTTGLACIMGIILAILSTIPINHILPFVIFVFVYFSMVGVIASCATAGALDGIPHMAGSGAALLGSLQYGSGILSSILLAIFSDGSALAMAWIMGVAATLSFIIALFIHQK